MSLDEADLIWNRAALERGGVDPGPGDKALADLLAAHNLIMNGGVDHAIEVLTNSELDDARSGYAFFGLQQVARLLANRTSDSSDTEIVDANYSLFVPDDSHLEKLFRKHLAQNPGLYNSAH